MATFNFEEPSGQEEAALPRFDFTESKPVAPNTLVPEQGATSSITDKLFGKFGGGAAGFNKKLTPDKPAEPTAAEARRTTSTRDFSALDEAITRITPAAPKSSVTPAVEGAGGAAFGMVPKQKFGGRYEGLTPPVAAQSPEVLSFAAEYMKTRMPNKPLAKDPVKLMEDFRDVFNKSTLDVAKELAWASNATPAQLEVARKAYEVAPKIGGRRIEEAAFDVLTDPFNYVGAGAGFLYKQAAVRTTQAAAKTMLKTAGVTAATEGVVGGGQSVLQQKANIELGLQKEMSYAAVAATAGLSIAVEGAVAASVLKGVAAKSPAERLADLKKTKAATGGADVTDEWLAKFVEKEKEVVDKAPPLFASAEERQAARAGSLDKMSAPTDTTEAVLSKPIVTDIFKVAKQLFKDNPELRPDLNEVKTTQGIVDALNAADEDIIQQAASRAGVKPADFLEAFKVQASEAGAFLQQAKSTADMLRKLTQGDPVLEDAFKRMLNAGDGVEYLSGKVLNATKTATGASVGASTAGLSTAVMNAIGLTGTVGIQTAGDIIESVIRTGGRMINDLRGDGAPINATRVKEDVGQIFADGGYVLSKLMDSGMSAELAEIALKNNPRLNGLINNVHAEVDLQGAPEIIKTINIFNRAVDGVVRRPIFLQSVQSRMKDVGLDFNDFVVNDKPIPPSLLRAAAEDTMKLTFSYDFKKTGEKGIEGFAEDAAFSVLRAINSNAGAGIAKDFLAPFIRFQLNAVRYTYRLTPVSGVGGIQELRQAAKLRAEGKTMEAAGLSYDGKRKVLDSAVGTAAIAGAMAFRENNSDVQFYQYKDDEGNVKDGSNLFPYVNIMALAEMSLVMKDLGNELWYAASMTPEERAAEAEKIKAQYEAMDVNAEGRQKLVNQYELLGLGRVRNFDGSKFSQIIAGMGRTAGTQKTVFDSAAELIEGGLTESMAKKAGTVVGDFVSRFDNFFNPLYDATNLLLDDMRVVDAKASTTMSGQVSPFTEAAVATVAAPIPGARDMLQSRPSLFQEEEQKAPTVMRQVTGERQVPPTSAIEKEFMRLNIQPYSVVKTTGNRDYDNVRIVMARPLFTAALTDTINNNPAYKEGSANEKIAILKQAVSTSMADTQEAAKDYFIAQYGESALNSLYEKAPNKEAQVDAFVRRFKRKPSAPIEKMMIIEGEFNDFKFALGGMVSKLVTKPLLKPLIEESVEAVAKKATSPVIEQMTKTLAPAPKPAVKKASSLAVGKEPPKFNFEENPISVAEPAPIASQMDEVLPPLADDFDMGATKPVIDSKTGEPLDLFAPNPPAAKAFADEDYIKGEASMLEQYTPEQLTAWKIANPEDYENTLHSFTAQAKGLKYSETPPPPFKPKMDESAESLIDEMDVSIAEESFAKKKPAVIDEDEAYYGVDEKYLKGDANGVAGKFDVGARNRVVSAIKTQREDTFFKLRSNNKFAEYDDDVLGVLLGEYRAARQVELNPKDPAMLDDAKKMADKYQKRLDILREKYKDVPPVKLYHGQSETESIDTLKRSGFSDPTKRQEQHQELRIGAPSFTKDLNLGLRALPFGGKNPMNYVSTEIPYADYVFNRINMKPQEYDKKDLNTILRAITGAPDVVRPVSLPRAGFLETEDMMLEPEKLLVKGKGRTKLKSAETDVTAAIERGGKFVDRGEVKKDESLIADYMKRARDSDDPKERMRLAYRSYTGIRNLMNGYLDMAKVTSTKTGIGQQYQAAIDYFSDYSGIQRQMNDIADILYDGGAKQKAENLRLLNDKLKQFKQSEPIGSTATDEAGRAKPLNEVMKLVPKLAKGGLATRR